jgi:endonuclease/exonuclease/phosphatase family metal-dependent hydrolase
MSTQLEHKRIHKGTWVSPDQNTINQIDHVFINTNKKAIREDVRSLRGPNIDSDHFLLKVIIKQKL